MRLSDQLTQAFNAQINLEFESAYAYLGMAGWCDANDLTGFARWLRAQAQEEVEHAMRFFRFVLEPRRLFRRYFIEDARFLAIAGREVWDVQVRARRRHPTVSYRAS